MGQWAWVDKTGIALDIWLDLCTFQQNSFKSFTHLINKFNEIVYCLILPSETNCPFKQLCQSSQAIHICLT